MRWNKTTLQRNTHFVTSFVTLSMVNFDSDMVVPLHNHSLDEANWFQGRPYHGIANIASSVYLVFLSIISSTGCLT